MRTIKHTSQFKRDFKREKRGQHGRSLDGWIEAAVTLLADDAPLPVRYRDHALSGDWKDYRECHIRPDLLLIYGKPDADTLELVRLGSHSELGF
jgi:mRNA interferase YafQ